MLRTAAKDRAESCKFLVPPAWSEHAQAETQASIFKSRQQVWKSLAITRIRSILEHKQLDKDYSRLWNNYKHNKLSEWRKAIRETFVFSRSVAQCFSILRTIRLKCQKQSEWDEKRLINCAQWSCSGTLTGCTRADHSAVVCFCAQKRIHVQYTRTEPSRGSRVA